MQRTALPSTLHLEVWDIIALSQLTKGSGKRLKLPLVGSGVTPQPLMFFFVFFMWCILGHKNV